MMMTIEEEQAFLQTKARIHSLNRRIKTAHNNDNLTKKEKRVICGMFDIQKRCYISEFIKNYFGEEVII